jgi:tetratricopeptide (TPR) repeat protein
LLALAAISTVRRVFRPSRLLSVFVLMLGTFVAYWPAMRNSFVWDDTALVLRDPLIRSWRLTPDAFREFLFLDATASKFYRPLQRLTFMADYAVWGIARPDDSRTALKTGAPDTGDNADVAAVQRAPQPGWHFTSVLVHALAALALWWLLRVWLGENGEWWALAAALAWALHPLHTSAVTYVSGRADSLAAIFVFSGLALVAKAHARGAFVPGDRPAARALIIAALCALAALLSKESGVALLVLWLVWVIARARRDPRGWLAWVSAAAIACSAYLALRMTAASTPPPPPSEAAPWQVRPILVARALAEYATLFIAPHSLHMERDVSTNPVGDHAANLRNGRLREAQTLAGLCIAAGLVWWWWRVRKSAPDAALALVCAAVTWLPVSNVFRLNATVAEHWIYVPSAFLFAAILFTARAIAAERPRIFATMRAVAALWLVFLAVQTWRQHGYWHDQRTFVAETIQRAGRGARMVSNLGQLAMQDGKPDEALALFREALAKEPKLALAHFNIATVASVQKDYDTALAELAVAEKSPLLGPETMVLRARIEQTRTGKPRLDLLGTAASSAGRMWSIARQYPLALIAMGQARTAYDDVLRQLTGHPYRAEAWRFRAEAWRFLGQIAEQLSERDVAARAYAEAANRDVRDDASRERLRALRSGL